MVDSYKTNDGRIFENRNAAQEHANNLETSRAIDESSRAAFKGGRQDAYRKSLVSKINTPYHANSKLPRSKTFIFGGGLVQHRYS